MFIYKKLTKKYNELDIFIILFRNISNMISQSKITNKKKLRKKFKTESPYTNDKIKSSNTSNERITTVIFLTCYRHVENGRLNLVL